MAQLSLTAVRFTVDSNTSHIQPRGSGNNSTRAVISSISSKTA
ncbi:hypothetical protein CCACVL1_24501 [Corchorus capsularis]|uniref:Uncharacterized protein n=1 Tax=Corchorus capsularis TaxID=210143 RepID=A0A1R3GPL5_COCAP|nr:hypothetical protein CCACVL1_24501 [Corchorus capsularis]